MNPFIERGRIKNPERFVGRWRELSLIFDRIESNRPLLITGVAGIGKSSLLTHVMQSAATNLEDPELRALYLDLTGAENASQVYTTLIQGLGSTGDDPAALEVTLATIAAPVVVCLDNAHLILQAGWGDRLLESLARTVRSGGMALVVAMTGQPPLLSERYAIVQLGAFATAEIRLLPEAYLEEGEVVFTPRDLAELARLSTGHPAYLQRAAFHLYRAKLDTSIDWRAEYLVEARSMPVPGSPLPPSAFEGEPDSSSDPTRYDLIEGEAASNVPPAYQQPEFPRILIYLVLVCIGVLLAMIGMPTVGVLVALVGCVAVWRLLFMFQRKGAKAQRRKE
jgi:AAA domain